MAVQTSSSQPPQSSQTQGAPTATTAPAVTTATTAPTATTATANNASSLLLEDRPQIVQDAFRHNTSLYYFGLGSNMLREKVAGRSSDGQGDILMEDFQAAVVHGHRLAFNLRGFPPLEPGMGSLEPVYPYDNNNNNDSERTNKKGKGKTKQPKNSKALLSYHSPECHGALIKLNPTQYERVMKSEGIGMKRSGYEEIVVTAVPYNTSQPAVQAIVLRARPHAKLNRDPSPSLRYMTILRQGAAELQLKPCYQEFLAAHPVQKTPLWMKRLALQNLIFTFSVGKLLNGWRGLSRLQSWFLFRVYVNSSAGKVRCAVSNALTAAILLPGAVAGMLLTRVDQWRGKEPSPFLARMSTLLKDDSTTSSTSNTTSASTSTAASTSSGDNGASQKQDAQVAA
jgi:hypothetical protein